MRIRGRLIIAFLLITVLPLGLISLCSSVILSNQASILQSDYQTDTTTETLLFNPFQILSTATMTDFTKLADIADTTPDLLAKKEYLGHINSRLTGRDSFLIVRRGEKDFYVGNTPIFQLMDPLPGFSSYSVGVSNTVSINNSILIRQKDFYFSDQTTGQLFLVTDFTEALPQWEASVKQLIISIALIILATAVLLVIWLYNGIVRPLNILQIATKQIGAGNLDEPVHVNSTDEIGELCRDFEEMRIRLKEMIEDRMRYEQDTRDMMSSMAHDLQTPLTSIKGYSDGILDGVANTPEKLEKYLRTIYTKASDMSYLVDELSVFAKVEQNSLTYHFISIPLHSYFEDCIDELSLDMETTHIAMHYENFCPRNTLIYADPEQLKRVIQNIVNNTAKYLNKKRGNLWLTIRQLPAPAPAAPLYRQLNPDGSPKEPEPLPPPEQFIQIEFRDDGVGINEKDLPHIFEKFYRADASRSSSKRGSGLGLAIVARIIADHGGCVWAKSTPGKGTCIFFTLKKINTETEEHNA